MLIAWVSEAVGRLATATGDIGGACAAHAEALLAYEEIGTDHDRCAVHLDLAAGALIAGELDRAAAELRLGLPPLAAAGVDRFVADGLDLAAALIAPADAAVGGADRRHRRRVPPGKRRRRIGRCTTPFRRWATTAQLQLGAQWERIWSSSPPTGAGDDLADATEVAMDALAPTPVFV